MEFCFCPCCSTRLVPGSGGKHGRRPYCWNCGFVQYRNPSVGVATVVIRDKKILLGRRKGTYRGLWCIPCGHVEWDEDVCAAAARECLEETGLAVCVERVFAVLSNFHDPDRQTVGVWFLTSETGGELQAGDDLDEVAFFRAKELPDLAFPTDKTVIEMLEKEGYIE